MRQTEPGTMRQVPVRVARDSLRCSNGLLYLEHPMRDIQQVLTFGSKHDLLIVALEVLGFVLCFLIACLLGDTG